MERIANEESELFLEKQKQEVAELICMLDNFKQRAAKKCEASSQASGSGPATVDDEVALIQKMVLIKRKSCGKLPLGACRKNRLDDDEDDESDGEEGEMEGLMSEVSLEDIAEEQENEHILKGGIKLGDINGLIELLDESLQEAETSEVDGCSDSRYKLVKRSTVVEEMLMVKRNSTHSVVFNMSACSSGRVRDVSGVCRMIVKEKKDLRSPKLLKTMAANKNKKPV